MGEADLRRVPFLRLWAQSQRQELRKGDADGISHGAASANRSALIAERRVALDVAARPSGPPIATTQ